MSVRIQISTQVHLCWLGLKRVLHRYTCVSQDSNRHTSTLVPVKIQIDASKTHFLELVHPLPMPPSSSFTWRNIWMSALPPPCCNILSKIPPVRVGMMTAYISSTEEMASLTFIVALTISAFNCLQRSLFGLHYYTLVEGKSCLDTPLYFIHILNIHIF